jgi:hypothetical protein
MPTRRFFSLVHDIKLMAVIMGLTFMTWMVMLMGLQFNGPVLVDMSLFVPLMGVGMFVLVRMGVRVLMGVGMPVLILPVLMGMLMFMPVPVLMFMGVVVFAFHLDTPPFLIECLHHCSSSPVVVITSFPCLTPLTPSNSSAIRFTSRALPLITSTSRQLWASRCT